MFEPMQLCVIFMPRRFRDTKSNEDMIVAFTGYIDSVSDGFDGTRHIITIQGSDVTKLMHVTQANINPTLWTEKLPGDSQYKIWQNRFGGLDGWEIIKLLTVGGEFDQEAGGGRIHGAGSFEINAIATNEDPNGPPFVDFSSIFDGRVSKIALLNGVSKSPAETSKDAVDKLEKLFFSKRTVHIQTLPFDNSPVQDLQYYSVFK